MTLFNNVDVKTKFKKDVNMKVKKLLDSDLIQCYSIINPSKKFKKMFPKKYITSLVISNKHVINNTNKLFTDGLLFAPIGYVFTYDTTLPSELKDIISSLTYPYENVGSTFACCLDTYFTANNTNTSYNIDLILSCSSKNNVVPPTFTENLIIRCNSKELSKNLINNINVKTITSSVNNAEFDANLVIDDDIESMGRGNRIKNIKNNIMTIVTNYLNNKKYNIEDWINDVVYKYPTNNNGLPVRYPNKIDNNNINNFKVKPNDLFIEYDFRASNYTHENTFITELEDAFERTNTEVQISDTYNGVLKNVIDELQKHNYKWKRINDDTISTKMKYLRDINVNYQLTDFI